MAAPGWYLQPPHQYLHNLKRNKGKDALDGIGWLTVNRPPWGQWTDLQQEANRVGQQATTVDLPHQGGRERIRLSRVWWYYHQTQLRLMDPSPCIPSSDWTREVA